MTNAQDNRITFRAFVLGTLFSAVFAVLTVVVENRADMFPTANQVPLFPLALLLATVLLLNPLCRMVRVIRPLNVAEVLVIFVMGTVSAGVSTYGFTDQIIPIVGSLLNPYWNNDQTEWNRLVEPFMNEGFFLSEEGIRKGAQAYVREHDEERELRSLYDRSLAARRDATRGASSNNEDSHQLRGLTIGDRPLEELLAQLPGQIRAQSQRTIDAREALKALEAEAAKRVELFRRGLPRGQRGFPGFVPDPHDDTGSYVRRFRRLIQGKRAARYVRQALGMLRDREAETGAASVDPRPRQALERAVEALTPLLVGDRLGAEAERLNRRDGELAAESVVLDEKIADLSFEKHRVSVAEAKVIESQVEAFGDRREALGRDRARLALAAERTRTETEITARVGAAAEGLREVGDRLETAPSPGDVTALEGILAGFPAFDSSLRRFFVGDVPWSHWVRPLAYWGLLMVLTYAVLMAFNVLIFRQWAQNEKLIYPLAELPQLLVGSRDSGSTGSIPAIFRSGLFWCGFGVSSGVLGWNLLCATGALPGLLPLDMTHLWRPYIERSAFTGLLPGARSTVFFSLIGIAFLIPKKVSFSLWFFWIVYMAQLLVLVWSGHGQNESSFPVEWWYTMNFRTAEGGGALLVFALVVLYKCRGYLLCGFVPAPIADLPRDEQTELRASSLIFAFGSIAIIGVLWLLAGVSFLYAVLGYAVIMVITIGLVRAVAEGGVLGFQAWVSPFHFTRQLFGFDHAWTAPKLFAPLMVYYAVFFLDIKTFIAPAMANSLKIRHDLKLSRRRFHLAIALGIGIAVVTSVAVAIMMSYTYGADSMQSWFYTQFPKGLFDRIAAISKTPPTATASGRMWLGAGVLMMAALLFFRQTFFWLPHPIGLIMLVNPIMKTFWFSIFLGWLGKSLVTRYGNKDTYARVRGAFVGLICGEIFIVAIAMVLSLILRRNLGIDLNRN